MDIKSKSKCTYRRFEAILRSLHFVNNETVDPNNKDRFIKLGKLLPDLIEKFCSLIEPGEFVCINESLMPFHGRLDFRQYNPLKRARFGVKTMILADCVSKIVLKLLPYQGKSTSLLSSDVELGFGGRSAVSLLDGYLGRGHRLVVDNWYMSPKLAHHLLTQNTYVLGTVRKTRKNMPTIKPEDKKLEKGRIQMYTDGKLLVERYVFTYITMGYTICDTILQVKYMVCPCFLRWMDRREVFMLNSFTPHEMFPTTAANPKNTRDKPLSVLIYNSKMGAVDDVDKQIRQYETMRKSIKWYKKYAFYLLDLCVYNTYRMYLLLDPTRQRQRYKPFLLGLIESMIEPSCNTIRSGSHQRQTVGTDHLPKCCRGASGRKSYSNCWLCYKTGSKRKQTCFKCTGCAKRLCIQGEESCFIKAHKSAQVVSTNVKVLKFFIACLGIDFYKLLTVLFKIIGTCSDIDCGAAVI